MEQVEIFFLCKICPEEGGLAMNTRPGGDSRGLYGSREVAYVAELAV